MRRIFALEKVQFDSSAQALKDTKVLRAEGPHTIDLLQTSTGDHNS